MTRWGAVWIAIVLASCTRYFDPNRLVGDDSCSTVATLREGPIVLTTSSIPGPLPSRGVYVRDPDFGTCMARINDFADGNGELALDAAEFNEDGSEMLVVEADYVVRRYGLSPIEYQQDLAGIFSGYGPQYVPGAGIFYHYGLQLKRRGTTDTVVFDAGTETFSFTPESLRSVGLSDDARYWAFTVFELGTQSERALIVWDRTTNQVIGHREGDFSGVAITMTHQGDALVMLDGATLSVLGTSLMGDPMNVPVDGQILDFDTVLLSNGHDAIVYVLDAVLRVVDLDDPTAQLPEVVIEDSLSAHPAFLAGIDGGASDRPGWVTLTLSNCGVAVPCAPNTQFAQDRIALVELATGRILDVGHHWAMTSFPFAQSSRDLRWIYFQTDWAGTHPARTVAAVIELPETVFQ